MSAIGEYRGQCYSVRAAAAAAGINPATLRAWETRYGLVRPGRSASGHRRYDAEEVSRLQKIATLVRKGHAISVVAPLASTDLDMLLRTPDELPGAPLPPQAEQRMQLVGELLDKGPEKSPGQMMAVAGHLRWLRSLLGARDFVYGVCLPLLGKLGGMVALSQISITAEHALSNVLRSILNETVQTLQTQRGTRAGEFPVVFATPEDDLHEFGILMGAVLVSCLDKSVWFAGANLPARSLAEAATALAAPTVVLGNSPVPAAERRVSFGTWLAELDRALPAGTTVLVGGSGDRPKLSSRRKVLYLSTLSELESAFQGAASSN